MKNYDKSVKINHNLNWLYIPNHLYRILIIGGSGPIKTNVLLNIIKHQRPDFDNFFFLRQGFTRIKVSITYQQERKSRDERIKKIQNLLIIHKQLMMFITI